MDNFFVEQVSKTNRLPLCRRYSLENSATKEDIFKMVQEKKPGCKNVYVWTHTVGKQVVKDLMIPEEE